MANAASIGNQTFRDHKRRIEDVVQKAIAAQVAGLTVVDICHAAKVSRQTFYKHYSSINDVQKIQERCLQEDFKKRVDSVTKREVLFIIILTFVKEHANYFSSVVSRQDFKMLTWMIDYIHPRLVPRGLAAHTYNQYSSVLKSIIQDWILFEKEAKQHLPPYVDALSCVRIMRSQLDDIPSLAKPSVHSTQVQS